MKINLLLFLSSVQEHEGNSIQPALVKTFESNIRPVQGDILDDPGFHPDFHNGYEVVKVTLNYSSDECWVSLTPLALELENLPIEAYVENLIKHGWRIVSKEELKTM
ncbi:hypothetical protein OIN60_04190 [Paenibacillus sp. P96]|uniref:Uncharacterized protein n=1 Tax=Paenibacillus zeirhizosphaerae TaxID=2987519 RepID=A0ABT9FMP4_9BACL|nr:hypothetical protein [Paenibacillus sp. P96]MDP4095987.1 hypothetical protein [Paenibacillus sp. P96]